MLPDARILVSAQEGVQGIVGIIQADPFQLQILKKVGCLYGDPENWSVTPDGTRVAFLDAAADAPMDVWTMKADSPFDAPALFQQRSAIHFAKNTKTPTLILHGQEDQRVPLSQGMEFYRALSEHGIPTQMIVYPREPHLIGEQGHRRDLLRRVLDWYDLYLSAK